MQMLYFKRLTGKGAGRNVIVGDIRAGSHPRRVFFNPFAGVPTCSLASLSLHFIDLGDLTLWHAACQDI
jgi:hypothetical protein